MSNRKRITTTGIVNNTNGLTFEEWAKQMNTPGVNRVVNKFGMPMSLADIPKIFPDPSCYSPHGIVHSNHGMLPRGFPNVRF